MVFLILCFFSKYVSFPHSSYQWHREEVSIWPGVPHLEGIRWGLAGLLSHRQQTVTQLSFCSSYLCRTTHILITSWLTMFCGRVFIRHRSRLFGRVIGFLSTLSEYCLKWETLRVLSLQLQPHIIPVEKSKLINKWSTWKSTKKNHSGTSHLPLQQGRN